MSAAASQAPSPIPQGQLFVYVSTSAPDPTELKQRLAAWQQQVPSGLDIEIALNDLPSQDGALGDAVSADADPLPDAVVTVTGDNETAIKTHLSELVDTLRPLLSDSSLVIGSQCYRILDGDGTIRLFYAIRRLPHMTRSQFQHYWLHHHADTGRQLIPPYSYLQSHSDDGLTQQLSQACQLPAGDFDGVVAIHFPDIEACMAQISREDVATIALEDEKKFIDHSRVLFGNYSVM